MLLRFFFLKLVETAPVLPPPYFPWRPSLLDLFFQIFSSSFIFFFFWANGAPPFVFADEGSTFVVVVVIRLSYCFPSALQ